jgi:hypothetical protein
MKFNVLALLVAWFLTICSAVTDLQGMTDSLALFGRMGAVMTLLAAIIEYQISTSNTFSKKPGEEFFGSEVAATVRVSDEEIRARGFAHISVIVGTLIWAFGDLITILNINP